MLRLLFLSSISLVVHAGCSDDCGPGNADAFSLLASDASTLLEWGNLTSSPNNDCPDPAAPAGVISLTLAGSQKDGTGLITLCISRPDLLAVGEVPLSTSGTGVRVIDLTAESMGCQYRLESLRPVLGNASSLGLCDNGTHKDGYALTVNGNLSMVRTCETSSTTVALTFNGTVAVKTQ